MANPFQQVADWAEDVAIEDWQVARRQQKTVTTQGVDELRAARDAFAVNLRAEAAEPQRSGGVEPKAARNPPKRRSLLRIVRLLAAALIAAAIAFTFAKAAGFAWLAVTGRG